MDRPSVTPEDALTAYCKDASAEQAQERDLDSSSRGWTEAASPREGLSWSLGAPVKDESPGAATHGPAMVQGTWTPSACPAERQREGGGWGTQLFSGGPAVSEVEVGPVHREPGQQRSSPHGGSQTPSPTSAQGSSGEAPAAPGSWVNNTGAEVTQVTQSLTGRDQRAGAGSPALTLLGGH